MYDENRPYWNGVNATHMRMMLKTCGYCDKDIKKKPHIGVANAYNSAAPGHAHLRQLAEFRLNLEFRLPAANIQMEMRH